MSGRWQDRPVQDPSPGLARRLMEAFVFAAAEPVGERAIAGLLLAQGVIVGRRPRPAMEMPERPTLWATSAGFLRHPGLRDLPRRKEFPVELPGLPLVLQPK